MEISAFTVADTDDLLNLMAAFNTESGYSFSAGTCRKLLGEILANPSLGQIWLLRDEEKSIGYLAICHCFSFEHGGRDAFVDEIYLQPAFRRKGLGRKMLQFISNQLHHLGIRALHLEVEDDNLAARYLYEQIGFQSTTRRLMTLKSASLD